MGGPSGRLAAVLGVATTGMSPTDAAGRPDRSVIELGLVRRRVAVQERESNGDDGVFGGDGRCRKPASLTISGRYSGSMSLPTDYLMVISLTVAGAHVHGGLAVESVQIVGEAESSGE
jgi:hypothetical protein